MPLCSFNLPNVHSKFQSLIKNNNINKKLSPSSRRHQCCQPRGTYLFRPGLSRCMKYGPCFSMPRMCPLSSFNGENGEVKLCWIWCCLLATTWAENQRYKSHPRPFVASRIVNTPADEQLCGKESPWELHICKRNLERNPLKESFHSGKLSQPQVSLCHAAHSQGWRRRRRRKKKKKTKRKIPHLLLTCIMISGENASACGHTLAPPLEEEGRSQMH